MLTDDEIKAKLSVMLSDASSEQASKEAAAGLAAHVLIAVGIIARVMRNASVTPVDSAKG